MVQLHQRGGIPAEKEVIRLKLMKRFKLTNQEQMDSIKSMVLEYKNKVNLRTFVIILCGMIQVFGYDPKNMRYEIGQRLRFYVILNWIRELSDLFSNKDPLPSVQTFMISPSIEWQFISDLLREFDRRQKTRRFRTKIVERDLEEYFITNYENKKNLFQNRVIEEERERQMEIYTVKRILNQKGSLSRQFKTRLNLKLDYLINKPFEQLFIGITAELTKDEVIKLKKFDPNKVYEGDSEKTSKIAKLITHLFTTILVELALKNAELVNQTKGLIGPQYYNYIFKKDNLMESFREAGFSELDYNSLFNFYLCPFIEILDEVHTAPGLLEMFLQYLNYFLVRERLNNSKMDPFEEQCYEILYPLKNRGIKLEYKKFPEQEIDILLFHPEENELFLIECKDRAPLYVPFIEELKADIQKEVKEQLDKKLVFIKGKKNKIKELFRMTSSDFKISLVGISKIKCDNYENIQFFAAYELEEHPEIILGDN